MSGDLLLTGGRVRTLDTAGTVAEAVLVEDGRIAAVGTSRDLTGRARPGTQALDLAGRTVIPGLIDAHAHLERPPSPGRASGSSPREPSASTCRAASSSTPPLPGGR
jgi:imidazolonepropionase-like amidohydrolase